MKYFSINIKYYSGQSQCGGFDDLQRLWSAGHDLLSSRHGGGWTDHQTCPGNNQSETRVSSFSQSDLSISMNTSNHNAIGNHHLNLDGDGLWQLVHLAESVQRDPDSVCW